MNGLLNLNKPFGITSREVVNRTYRACRPAKVGHAGTLDPLASGVIIACVGASTRLTPYLHDLSKAYRATFRLGYTSPTDDLEGEATPVADAPLVSSTMVEAALSEFEGEIDQLPPAFSAVRVRGQRAYDLARAGRTALLTPRSVVVHQIQLVDYSWPDLTLDIDCGSGVYVRSIGRDLGASLGTGAVMTSLVRTRIGPWTIDDALAEDDWTTAVFRQRLITPRQAIAHVPQYEIDVAQVDAVRQGRWLKLASDAPAGNGDLALVRGHDVIAIGCVAGRNQCFQPNLVLRCTKDE